MSVEKIKSEEIKPYEQDAEKKQQVSKMFNNISGKYDFLNHFLSAGIDRSWRKKAIQELKDVKPKIILDVATGTGDLALEAQKQLNPTKIIGIDIAVKMLDIGRKKIDRKGLNEIITLDEGDSENLPFEDNYFDAIIVAFGVRNFANVENGLKEMIRVLKPEGKCVILEFSKPKVFPVKQLYSFYFSTILPGIGKMTSKDKKAYSYLYESVQAFPEGKDFEQLLIKLGLNNTKCEALTMGICSIYTGTK